MLSALDSDIHCERLRDLRNGYHNQERFMTRALINLQAELDDWQESLETFDQELRNDLKTEHAERSIERSHIRMAMAGADEELANYRRQLRIQAGSESGLGQSSYQRLGA